jgi:hypothetical protein
MGMDETRMKLASETLQSVARKTKSSNTYTKLEPTEKTQITFGPAYAMLSESS